MQTLPSSRGRLVPAVIALPRTALALASLASFALAPSCATEPPPPPPAAPQVAAAPAPAAPAPAAAAPASPRPPVARKAAHVETLHGAERADEYFWLRQKDTPDVVNYLKAENAYTDAVMKPTGAFQDALYKEMLARIKETDVSVPYREGGWFYYSRTEQGKQYPILCRKSAQGAAAGDRTGAGVTSAESVMLDMNEIGKTEKFVGLGSTAVSDDGNLFAFALDTTGFRQFTLAFKDLRTGSVFPERIPRVDAVAWARDNKTSFYVVEDEVAKRAYRLYRHVLGTDPGKDALVYEEKDEMFDLDVERTRSKGYLVATSRSKTTSEVRVLDAGKPEGAWTVVEPRQHDHEYYVDHRGASFWIRTNAPATAGGPKARNFRLVVAPVKTPGRKNWKEVLPHRDDVMLESIDVFAGHTVLHERADALPRLRILPAKAKAGSLGDDVKMPEAIYALFGDANAEFDTTWFRFHYQSPVTPDSVFDYDVKSKEMKLQKRQEVLGGFDPARYDTARTYATASDGTRIPISLVYKKGLRPDPAHPLPMLLYGYGSYGVSIPLTFSSNRVSLLDRGVVWGLAHIRGGGDMGKAWHEGGRMATKMNTFTDFIACAEALVQQGWTGKDRLIIEGGSAGGLLMGAVTNLRPDLWKAVVAHVPFVDVVNTMLDETLPLTVGEFEEWGNPKKKDEYAWMAPYSPYDNVAAKDYPAILVMTSYNDSQVMYWEPAKYVARLRARKTDRNPLLLKVNMEPAGHGGQSGRYNQLHENAFSYAFLLGQLGITK